MASVIVFDVNETLLDLAGFDALFQEVFGDASVRNEWFAQMLNSAFVSTITDDYHPFGAIGGAAFMSVAERRGKTASPEQLAILGETLRSLPPHPDTRPGLERLSKAGFRLAALTNSTLDVAHDQLARSALDDLFEATLSADTVKRLKPAPEPYHAAAQALNADPGDCRMVAAHGWDIYGALHAGMQGAFIARPGKVLDPVGPIPDIVGESLIEVADLIISADKS